MARSPAAAEARQPLHYAAVNDALSGADKPLPQGNACIGADIREFARLVSQSGLFTRAPWGETIDEFVRKKFKGTSKHIVLVKLHIPEAGREDCLRTLNRMNIKSPFTFPGLGRLGRTLQSVTSHPQLLTMPKPKAKRPKRKRPPDRLCMHRRVARVKPARATTQARAGRRHGSRSPQGLLRLTCFPHTRLETRAASTLLRRHRV
jgi:hypothetical protein